MTFGTIYDEPADVYHATDCVSAGRLDDIKPRPIVYFKKWIERSIPPRNDTDALKFGRLFHCLALEGEDATRARFAVAPKCDRRTKSGKEEFAAFVAQHEGKEITDEDSMTLAWRMVTAIRANPAAVEYLKRGKPEVTFRKKLGAFAVQCRVDWYDEGANAGPLCLNLKSIDCLDGFDLQYSMLHYYRNDAFYRLVVAHVLGVHPSVPQMVNLVVEKQEPFEVCIRTPDSEALDLGTREVMRLLRVVERCYENGFWPGEPNEARQVSLERWKVKQLEAEEEQ